MILSAINRILIAAISCVFLASCTVTSGSDNDGAVVTDDDDETVPADDDDVEPFTGCDELWSIVNPPADFDEMCNPNALDLLDLELQMYGMINADREQHAAEANNAEPLQYDCAVAEVARRHSYDMCWYSLLYQEFENPLTPEEEADNPIDRYDTYLGLSYESDFYFLGENVAYSDDLQVAEDNLVESELPCSTTEGSNRLNILDYNFSHVGVGLCNCVMWLMDSGVTDTTNYLYLTQDFITYDYDFLKMDDKNPYCDFEW